MAIIIVFLDFCYQDVNNISFFKNGPTLASFSFIFGLFKQTIIFLQQINVKNVHPEYSARN